MEETIEAKIGRYLSGEMTGMERDVFEQEISTDPTLTATWAASQRIWQHQPSPLADSWDTEKAWESFAQSRTIKGVTQLNTRRRTIAWAIAASTVFLVAVYSLFFSNGTQVTYTYQDGMLEPIELKDGSKIYLNKGAEVIAYPFSGRKRHIALKGEAFFEITSDVKRPFTINTGETLTEVVGTSFNIRQSSTQTHIFVNSGKIIFSSLEDAQVAVALTEGEAAFYEGAKMLMIPNPSPNVSAWKTQQLRFVKMPLSSVVADISSYFDQKIIIENEASKACIITIPNAFKKPEISSVLNAVATSINAKLVKDGDTYIIKGGRSCIN